MKKAFIFIFFAFTLLTAAAPARLAPKPAGKSAREEFDLPIIMYHRVMDGGKGAYCISPSALEEDLIFIKKNGYTPITAAELISFTEGKGAVPDKPVMLTFDDCHYDNYTQAFPLLSKYGVKATFFVIGEFSDRFSNGRKQTEGRAHLNYEQIKEMLASGLCDFANHTYGLHDYGRGRYGIQKRKDETVDDYKKVLETDIIKNSRKLSEYGADTPALAYPFGAYNRDAEEIVKALGYKAMFTTDEGINKIKLSDPETLTRLKRFNRYTGRGIRDILS